MSSARRGGMQSRHSRVASMSGPYESNHNGRVSSGWQRDSQIINRVPIINVFYIVKIGFK